MVNHNININIHFTISRWKLATKDNNRLLFSLKTIIERINKILMKEKGWKDRWHCQKENTRGDEIGIEDQTFILRKIERQKETNSILLR